MSADRWDATEKISNSNPAFYLPKSLEHLQTSGAFFLTFHDAIDHMKGPFEYSRKIVLFCLVNGCFLERFRNTPKNSTILNEYSNGPLIW